MVAVSARIRPLFFYGCVLSRLPSWGGGGPSNAQSVPMMCNTAIVRKRIKSRFDDDDDGRCLLGRTCLLHEG